MQRLSKTQERIVNGKQRGISIVRGSNQMQLMEVALGKMINLNESVCPKSERILWVSKKEESVQRATAYLNEHQAYENISFFDNIYRNITKIKSMNQLIEEAAAKAFVYTDYQKVVDYPEEIVSEAMKEVRSHYPTVKWLKLTYSEQIIQELTWISENKVQTLDQYLDIARKGTSMRLLKKGKSRQAIWKVKESVSQKMKAHRLIRQEDLAEETLIYLKADCLKNCYQHLIISDAELLTKAELDILYALWQPKKGSFLLLMNEKDSLKEVDFLKKEKVKNLSLEVKPRRQKVTIKKTLTPLETFMMDTQRKQERNTLEVYRFINSVTGRETTFEKDSSAGEIFIDDIKQEQIEVLPVYSDIAAGAPIEVIEGVQDEFKLPSDLLYHHKRSYVLPVQGDSMIGADISDGDWVIIEPDSGRNGEIVAVYYKGAITLKRIVKEEGRILLISENEKYQPIIIEEDDFRVMGRLIGVIKPLAV